MLQPCDLLFYHGSGFSSRLIRFLSKSKYSHVAIVLDENNLLEIDWKYSAKIRPIPYKKEDYDIYEYIGLTKLQKYSILQSKYDFIGVKYSWFENIRILLKLYFGIKLKDDISKINCIELVVDMYKRGEIELLDSNEANIFEDIINNPNIKLKR